MPIGDGRSRAAAATERGRWYDGLVYQAFITPLQKEISHLTLGLIPDQSTVIDVGCGPGALALRLAVRCEQVVGIDSSPRMVAYAERRWQKSKAENVTFRCADASEAATFLNTRFSHAILCLCLHGMPETIRRSVVTNCLSCADKLVITDYRSPFPRGPARTAQHLIEYLEGRDTYPNFRSWQELGGIDGFIHRSCLGPVAERPWSTGFGKTVLVQGST